MADHNNLPLMRPALDKVAALPCVGEYRYAVQLLPSSQLVFLDGFDKGKVTCLKGFHDLNRCGGRFLVDLRWHRIHVIGGTTSRPVLWACGLNEQETVASRYSSWLRGCSHALKTMRHPDAGKSFYELEQMDWLHPWRTSGQVPSDIERYLPSMTCPDGDGFAYVVKNVSRR